MLGAALYYERDWESLAPEEVSELLGSWMMLGRNCQPTYFLGTSHVRWAAHKLDQFIFLKKNTQGDGNRRSWYRAMKKNIKMNKMSSGKRKRDTLYARTADAGTVLWFVWLLHSGLERRVINTLCCADSFAGTSTFFTKRSSQCISK